MAKITIIVPMTVEVDTEAWTAVYCIPNAEAEADVLSYLPRLLEDGLFRETGQGIVTKVEAGAPEREL